MSQHARRRSPTCVWHSLDCAARLGVQCTPECLRIHEQHAIVQAARHAVHPRGVRPAASRQRVASQCRRHPAAWQHAAGAAGRDLFHSHRPQGECMSPVGVTYVSAKSQCRSLPSANARRTALTLERACSCSVCTSYQSHTLLFTGSEAGGAGIAVQRMPAVGAERAGPRLAAAAGARGVYVAVGLMSRHAVDA